MPMLDGERTQRACLVHQWNPLITNVNGLSRLEDLPGGDLAIQVPPLEQSVAHVLNRHPPPTVQRGAR
jgi:hypothetical protein